MLGKRIIQFQRVKKLGQILCVDKTCFRRPNHIFT